MTQNMLKRAANFVQDKAEQHMVEDIVYERPGVGQVALKAIVGETDYSQDNQTGLVDRVVQRDYTIRQSKLVIADKLVVPKRNDIIRQPLDNGTVYEGRVLGEGGMPHYQASDGYGVAWRIHTKLDEVITN